MDPSDTVPVLCNPWRSFCSVWSSSREKSNDSKTFKVYESIFPHSTAVHALFCLTYRVYNQSQSISSNPWIVNHYEDLHFMNILCEPSALSPIPLHCIGYSGYRPNYDKEKALSWHITRCSQTRCPQRTMCKMPPISEMFNLLCLFYSTTSTGAVLLWVSFLLLGQMKTSWSFVARVFLHSLNQPTAFCSACGVASVLACSSPPLLLFIVFCSLPSLLITSQDVT